METQEVKWLFQNCRGSEVKSETEFRFLCSYLYQVVQVGASSWVSRSCWTPYSLGKKKKFLPESRAPVSAALCFSFLISHAGIDQAHVCLAEVCLLRQQSCRRCYCSLLRRYPHFGNKESSSEPNYHGKPKYVCCNSPNKCLWRECAELLLIYPIKSSWLLKKFLSLSRGFRQGRANGCSWVAKALSGHEEGRQGSPYRPNS